MDLTNIGEIKKLLHKHDMGTKKSLGQNFLISPSVPKKIAAASLNLSAQIEIKTEVEDADAGVIEIGAGVGALSQELCKLYKKVVAVELDRKLEPVLGEIFGGTENFKVVYSDILKVDLKALVESEFSGYKQLNVCANLPYYITTPVLVYLLESGVKFNAITIMIQKEVAARLCAKPGGENYGSITLFLNYYGEIKKLFDVSASNFYPPPKVTSSVVRIIPYDIKMPRVMPKDEAILFKIIRAAFEQRRKTLVNALSSAFTGDYDISKSQIAAIIEEVTGDVNIRGETLSIESFTAIADLLFFFTEKEK